MAHHPEGDGAHSAMPEEPQPAAADPGRRPKRRRKAVGQKRGASLAGAGQAPVEEEENPGLLLADLVDQPEVAAPRLRRAAAAGRRRQKRPPRPADPVEQDADEDIGAEFASGDEGDAETNEAGSRLLDAMGKLKDSAGQPPVEDAGRAFGAEGRPESEFHSGGGGEAITVDDLLAPLAEATGFGNIRKQLQGLARAEPLPEPASETARSREERLAQYDSSCNVASRWIPQVQQMRRADQVILGKEEDQDTRPVSTASLVDTFKATDDFEKELEAVTMAAGATEKDIKGAAELPANPKIRDEKERQAGAKLKSLLLREQQAAKRIKKIKSKTYRRIHRKAESREKEVLLERLERENPELAKTLKLEYEKKHAQMRLQRGRNARKKWANTMNRFAKGDRNAQQEMTRQAQKAHDEEQALRRAIRGRDPDQSEDSEAVDLSESDSEGEGGKPRGVARQTLSRAKKLTAGELKTLEKDGDLPTTGLLGMNFMRNAIQQKREQAKKDAQGVLEELEGLGQKLDAAEDSDNEGDRGGDARGAEREGRNAASAQGKPAKIFTAEELAAASAEVDAMLEQDDAAVECSVSGPLTIKGVAAAPPPGPPKGAAETAATSKVGTSRPSREPTPGQGAGVPPQLEAAAQEASRNPWLSAGTPEADGLADSAAADAEEAAGGSAPSGPGTKAAKAKKRKRRADADAEPEAAAAVEDLLSVLNADSEAAREQRDLVRTAFVEGTQAEDFDAEQDELARKKDEERDSASKELAGWGSWTGEGVAPRRPRSGKEKPASAAPDCPGAQRPRARVQFHEGGGAEPSKYFVDQMPYPFQSPDQYEATMRQPLGREWNALPSHLQKIKPKFFSKVGAIVPPLQYVKHLPSEQRDSALKTWAATKQPKRLKAKI